MRLDVARMIFIREEWMGVITQALVVHGATEDNDAEFHRLNGVSGPRWIVSPSHEALLPDVPPVNVGAMAARHA